MLIKQRLLQNLIRGRQAFCEQIICLYHKPEQRDWWHELLVGSYE